MEGDPRYAERRTLDFKVSHGVGDFKHGDGLKWGWGKEEIARHSFQDSEYEKFRLSRSLNEMSVDGWICCIQIHSAIICIQPLTQTFLV